MSYIVIKTINGRQYRYQQTSYRVGKKVKTKSVYLGPGGGNMKSCSVYLGVAHKPRKRIFTPIPAEERGLRYINKMMEKYPTPSAETTEEAANVNIVSEQFTADTGLTLPGVPENGKPVEKVPI